MAAAEDVGALVQQVKVGALPELPPHVNPEDYIRRLPIAPQRAKVLGAPRDAEGHASVGWGFSSVTPAGLQEVYMFDARFEGNILGLGVFHAQYYLESNGSVVPAEQRVVKVILRSALERHRADPVNSPEDALWEINMMRFLDGHPNIMRILGVYVSEEFLFVAMPYMSGPDPDDSECVELFTLVVRNRLRPGEAKAVCGHVANALRYMHSLHIAHADLSCENVLVVRSRSEPPRFPPLGVVIDFGQALATDGEGRTPYLRDRVRTRKDNYLAPELLLPVPRPPPLTGFGIDSWAFAIVVYISHMRSVLWPLAEGEVYQALVDPGRTRFQDFFEQVLRYRQPVTWYDMMQGILVRPPDARTRFSVLGAPHPYFLEVP